VKLEIENPTGSFKDRGSVVEIAKASEYGYRNVVCASTGNMAYSIAYYAKLYDIKAKIFISHDANEDKIRKIRSVGNAEIERVDGDFNKALKLAEAYSKRSGAFLTGDYCYRQEGQRTIAYELANQLGGITDVIVPVGNATLISGMLKAYSEFDKAPRVIGVQSSSCKPLFDAFNGKPLRYEAPRTKADAIAVGLPTFGEQALDLIRKSKGMIVTVSDIEMAREQKRFYEEFGRFVELAGAASIAAYRKIKTNRKGRVVAVITGGNV
jgi:threonine synthase